MESDSVTLDDCVRLPGIEFASCSGQCDNGVVVVSVFEA